MASSLITKDDSNGKAALRNIVKFIPLRQYMRARGPNFSLVSTVNDMTTMLTDIDEHHTNYPYRMHIHKSMFFLYFSV